MSNICPTLLLIIKKAQHTRIILVCIIAFSIIVPTAGYCQFEVDFQPISSISNVDSPFPVEALDIPYDEIDPNRQAFHLFLPDTVGTFPLVIFYHGGGFTGGSRNVALSENGQNTVRFFLENGIAFASVGYRLIASNGPDEEGVIKSLNDSKRALQFIRHFSEELKITSDQIALSGTSAGAGTALWLATRDDMADPSASDPILTESTRVLAGFLSASQATYDIPKWESVVYTDFGFTLEDLEAVLGFDRLSNFYGGVSDVDQLFTDETLIQYRQDVDMLFHMSDDDPPIYIQTGSGAALPEQDVFHHHAMGQSIMTHAIDANLPEVISVISFLGIDTSEGESGNEFLVRHLGSVEDPDDEEPIVLSTNDIPNDQIGIYPNPSSSRLFIQSNSVSPEYWVYNLQGQLLANGSGKEIDLSAMVNGTYLLRIDQNILKFVKQ